MSRLIILLIITSAACVCSGRQHHSDLPRKWLAAADKRSTQAPLMDPCQKERSMKMICHCDQQNIAVHTAECWILKNDLTAHDPIWRAFDKYTAMTDLKFIVQSGSLNFLPTSIFKNLINLVDLSLSFSHIMAIESFAFANSSSLRTVRLNNNNLTILERFAFANHQRLERVDLQENELTLVDREAFSNLSKLEYLALNDNRLTDLIGGTFKALKNLEELQLQHNFIATCASDMFLGLENLRVLKLSSNKIKSVGNGVFTELWSLQELYLDNNNIDKISERAFDGLNNLRSLSLQRNRLKQLERNVFTSLPGISWLNLSENRLKILHYGTFSHVMENFVAEESNLALNGNELICDCKLDWLIELRNRTRSVTTRQSLHRLTCLLVGSNNIPEELVQNTISAENTANDYISDDNVVSDPSQVQSVDLEQGAMVNLFLLDKLPCNEDASDPTSLPLPRESIGFRDGNGGDHPLAAQLSLLVGTILGVFVILHNNNNLLWT